MSFVHNPLVDRHTRLPTPCPPTSRISDSCSLPSMSVTVCRGQDEICTVSPVKGVSTTLSEMDPSVPGRDVVAWTTSESRPSPKVVVCV